MSIKKRHNDDGSTTLSGRDGKEYRVPEGIYIISETDAEFKADTQRKVEDALHGALKVGDGVMSSIYIEGVDAFKVYWNRTGQLNVWVLNSEGNPIGWAMFNRRAGRLEESRAVIHPKYRGMGIYPALLRLLKRKVSPIVLSDRLLTVANALQWMRHGTYDLAHRRIRLNPVRRIRGNRPTKQALQRAVVALYTRDATR